MLPSARSSRNKEDRSDLNPIIDGFDKAQRERDKKKEEYIKELKQQME